MSHHHLHLNPTHVIDHIKTKVKQRGCSTKGLPKVSGITTDDNIHGNQNNIKRTSDEHNELKPNISSTKTPSPTIRVSEIITDQDSPDIDENKNKEENNLSIKKDETDGFISDQIDRDEDNSGTVQWTKDRILSDAKSNCRLSKVSKSLSASIEQSNTKRRRQTVRRRVSSSSKKQHNKIQTRGGRNNMEALSYLIADHIRYEDFNTIFSDLPSDEQLFVAYPCAWRKDMLMHGRMFLSVNYLCFFKSKEESLCLPFKDIVSVRREKSVKVLSNAIKVRTNNREQYIFVSVMPREKMFITIFRLWQNALLEKPLDYQQLRRIVFADQLSMDESTGDSDESAGLENIDGYSPDPSLHSQSISPNSSRESCTTFIPLDQGMVSSLLDKEQTTYVSSCSCENHLARTIIDQTFSYHVDKLHELIFDDNAFSRAYRDSQKLTDFNFGDWHINNETDKRERQVTYKTISQSVLGTNSVTCTEKQIIEAEIPHSMYVIRTEIHNEGVKYTDAFFIATQYCLVQRDAEHCSLRMSTELKYIKNVNGIIKSFIEKNCNASIDDSISNLVRRLESEQSTVSNPKSDQKQTTARKEHRRKKKHETIRLNENKDGSVLDCTTSLNKQVPVEGKTITGKGALADIALFIGIFLLLLHIYLCYKLYYMNQLLHIPDGICINQCKKGCFGKKIH